MKGSNIAERRPVKLKLKALPYTTRPYYKVSDIRFFYHSQGRRYGNIV
jgi:hypothetical protein